MLRHEVEQVGALFEGAHHAGGRGLEHIVCNVIEQVAFELEVDQEVDESAGGCRGEGPGVGQVLERSAFGCADQDLPGSVQGDLAGKAFAEWSEADFEVGEDLLRRVGVDAHAAAPGDEGGVVFDVGDDREELVGAVGEGFLFFVAWHVHPLRAILDRATYHLMSPIGTARREA